MKHVLARTARWTLAAGVAGALAFGATQAVAAPATDPVAGVGLCTDDNCHTFCKAVGYGTGWCASGRCVCYID